MNLGFSRVVLVLLMAAVPFAQAGSEPASARLDYDSFKIITKRNIFDPNRSGKSSTRARAMPDSRAAATTFSLVGTLRYEKGSFAFFEGSSSQYRLVLEPSDTIAGYKITDIAPGFVTLESTNGQAIALRVGMQMRKLDEGQWLLAGPADSSEGSSPSIPSDNAGHSASAAEEKPPQFVEKRDSDANDAPPEPPQRLTEEEDKAEKVVKTEVGSNGGADEVLKRLMQKRERELNK